MTRAAIPIDGGYFLKPAAKLARREGVLFILDPLWQNVSDDLLEHIDGLRSGFYDPNRAGQSESEDGSESPSH